MKKIGMYAKGVEVNMRISKKRIEAVGGGKNQNYEADGCITTVS